jgi:hypothetical protein
MLAWSWGFVGSMESMEEASASVSASGSWRVTSGRRGDTNEL